MTVINIKEKKLKNKFKNIEILLDEIILKANQVKAAIVQNKYALSDYTKLKKKVNDILNIDVQERLIAEELALFLENEAIFLREHPNLDFIETSKLMHVINEEIINTTNYFIEKQEEDAERRLENDFKD